MNRHIGWGIAALLLGTAVLGVPVVVTAQATTTQWRATATGANEVPAKTSTATGTFTATLNEAERTLTWTLKVPSIEGATMAHIHVGAPGTNGAIVVNLFQAGSTGGFSSIDTSGTARVNDIVGPLQADFTGFVNALKGGTLYVNVHTVTNPGGEIRGQIAQATATSTATATPKATATATVAPGTAPKAATPVAVAPAAPKSGSA